MSATPYLVDFQEDSTATVLARIASIDGSGAATGKGGEGNYLQQADITSIDWAYFDLDGATPTVAEDTGTLTVSSVVLDTVITANSKWDRDTYGYNFRHDIPTTWFTTGGNTYQVEYKFTLSGTSNVFFLIVKGEAKAVRTS